MLAGLINGAIRKMTTQILKKIMVFNKLIYNKQTASGNLIGMVQDLQGLILEGDNIYTHLYAFFSPTVKLPLRYHMPDLETLLSNLKNVASLDALKCAITASKNIESYLQPHDITFCKLQHNLSYVAFEKKYLLNMQHKHIGYILDIIPKSYQRSWLKNATKESDIVVDLIFLPMAIHAKPFYN